MNNEEFAQKNTCCLKKVLVTGASGFIGSFLVEGGLEREMQVWAGVRKSSSRTYLKDPRIQFAELDFAHPGRLTEQLAVHKQLHGDGIISFIVPV
jgi:Nucleoside-diphosphate-sugar epimerases